MTNSLAGKIAVVTGSGSGIGLAIAQAFVSEGARVVITGRRQDVLEKAAEKIGEGCTVFKADVSNADDLKRLFAVVRTKHQRLDIVVANAGVGDNAPLGQITEPQFDKLIGTNLKGVLLTVQAGLPLMKKGASVIIVGSTASARTPPHMSLYGATKAGVSSFVRTWMYRREARPNKLSAFEATLKQALTADARRVRHERRTARALHTEIKAAGYDGGYSAVTDFVRAWRQGEGQAVNVTAFVPLTFELGEAFQFDWSEEGLVVGGIYFDASVVDQKLVHQLATLEFTEAAHNVVWRCTFDAKQHVPYGCLSVDLNWHS